MTNAGAKCQGGLDQLLLSWNWNSRGRWRKHCSPLSSDSVKRLHSGTWSRPCNPGQLDNFKLAPAATNLWYCSLPMAFFPLLIWTCDSAVSTHWPFLIQTSEGAAWTNSPQPHEGLEEKFQFQWKSGCWAESKANLQLFNTVSRLGWEQSPVS